jgi:hypothetical protein
MAISRPAPLFGVIWLLFTAATAAAAPLDPYAPLWLYNGSWDVRPKDQPKPDRLANKCALIGRFFACEQSVNGTPGALQIFIPAPGKPGHYYTQNVRPEGRAGGRGDLEIAGELWTYTSTWDEGGKTIYYRTTNVFTGRNKIHFEQAESENNKTWVVKNSGDEIRVAGGAAKADR